MCQLLHRKGLGEVFLGVAEHGLDAIGFRRQFQQRRMLRLAAGAAVVHHQFLRHGPGQLGAVVLFHHGQCEVDTRGHAGRSPDRTVDHVDAISLDLDRRKPRLQFPGVGPVGGGPPSVEQAGLGHDERPGADRRGAARAVDAGLQVLQHGLGRLFDDRVAADHDDGVEHAPVEGLGANAQATRSAQVVTVFRQHAHVIQRLCGTEIGVLEHRHGGQRHGLETLENHERHADHRPVLKRLCPKNVL
ncbi:hypothetical protein D3C73_811450 [compost metagenome]